MAGQLHVKGKRHSDTGSDPVFTIELENPMAYTRRRLVMAIPLTLQDIPALKKVLTDLEEGKDFSSAIAEPNKVEAGLGRS